MLEKLKRLWPFVLRIEKEIADNLAATLLNELRYAESERDAADLNAGRAWKAADELAERLAAAQDRLAELDRELRAWAKRHANLSATFPRLLTAGN
jgi:chromosome segregation ATPase